MGLRAQGPVCPGVVGCRWSLRACRHGTLGRLHCGCRRSHLGLSSALFWVEAAVVPAVVLLGVPCPEGPPDIWGPGLFHACFMPCGMGLCPHTHYETFTTTIITIIIIIITICPLPDLPTFPLFLIELITIIILYCYYFFTYTPTPNTVPFL